MARQQLNYHRQFRDLVDLAKASLFCSPSQDLTCAEYEVVFGFVTGVLVDLTLNTQKATNQLKPSDLTHQKVCELLRSSHSCDLSPRGEAPPRDNKKSCEQWLDGLRGSWENDPQRQVRPMLIRWLCTSRDAQKVMDPQGIAIREAWISDTLDLYALQRPKLRIAATRCSFYGTVCLSDAKILELKFKHCWMVSTAKNQNDDWHKKSEVTQSEIDREQRNTQPRPKEGYDRREYKKNSMIPQRLLCSFSANSLCATGGVRLRSVVAHGPIEMNGCDVDGNVSFEDATVKHNAMGSDFYPAIAIDSGQLGHDLILQRAIIDGVVHLEYINLKGNALLRGSRINYKHQPNHAEFTPANQKQKTGGTPRSHRNALTFAGAKIKGDIELDCAPAWGNAYESGLDDNGRHSPVRTRITGGFSLLRTRIGGNLTLCSAEIKAQNAPVALNGIRCSIGGRINARGESYRMSPWRTEFYGSVLFVNATIGNRVDFRGAKLSPREATVARSPKYQSDSSDPYSPIYEIGAWSLDFRKANIGARVILADGFEARSGICFRSAHIGDRLLIRKDVTIISPDHNDYPATRDRSIDARLVHIEGSVNIEGPDTQLSGWVDFSLAELGGKFSVGEYVDDKQLEVRKQQVLKGKKPGNGWWVTIGIEPDADGTSSRTARYKYPAVDIRSAKIASQFLCGNPLWKLGKDENFFVEQDQGNEKIYLPRELPTKLYGSICADQATIGYSVELGCVELHSNYRHENPETPDVNPPISSGIGPQYGFTSAADFTNSRIGEDLRIDGAMVRGGLCFDSVQIEQDLIFRCGLIYSARANDNIDIAESNEIDWMKARRACGRILYHDRYEFRSWALALRHANIKRTISIRSSAIFHGALMIEATNAGGYFELSPTDASSTQYLETLQRRMLDSFTKRRRRRTLITIYSKLKVILRSRPNHKSQTTKSIYLAVKVKLRSNKKPPPQKLTSLYRFRWWVKNSGLINEKTNATEILEDSELRLADSEAKEVYWPITWSINLRASKLGVIYWSFDRSGYIDGKDLAYLKKTRMEVHPRDVTKTDFYRSLHSLGDMLFINDLTYENIWFFDDQKKLEISDRDVFHPDLMMSSRISETADRWTTCRRFLHLQPMAAHLNERRNRYTQSVPGHLIKKILSDDNPYALHSSRGNTGGTFRSDALRPQPFEEFAKAARTHGRQDLYLFCQVEKWMRLTRNSLNRSQPVAWVFAILSFYIKLLILVLILPGLLLGTLILMTHQMSDGSGRWGYPLLLGLSVSGLLFGFWLAMFTEPAEPGKSILRSLTRYLPTLSKFKYGTIGTSLAGNMRGTVTIVHFVLLWLFGWVAGHGYRPFRIVMAGVFLLVAGTICVSKARDLEIIRPSSEWGDRVLIREDGPKPGLGGISNQPEELAATNDSIAKPIDDNALASDYPAFHAFWYSADLLIPVIGLEQAEYWQTYPFKENSPMFRELVAYQRTETLEDRLHRTHQDHFPTWETRIDWIDKSVMWAGQPIYEASVTYMLSDYEDKRKDESEMKREAEWKQIMAVTMHLLGPGYTLLGWLLVTMGIASVTRLIRHD